MMEWTDRHCRYFHRQLTRHARLYTEMLTTGTLLHGDAARHLEFDAAEHPYEIRLRFAARADNAEIARIVGEEVESLYTNGPAGGGGVRSSVHEQIGIVSTLIDRVRVIPRVTVREWVGYAEAI